MDFRGKETDYRKVLLRLRSNPECIPTICNELITVQSLV
jgi:hypothetical protein